LAVRLYERSGVVTDGAKRFRSTCWLIERDTERPGTVQLIRCATRADAEAELGDETPENQPWLLRRIMRPDRWRL
jgi:hypothetical protein